MNRLLEWAEEHITDFMIMCGAFCRGFAEGMRKR